MRNRERVVVVVVLARDEGSSGFFNFLRFAGNVINCYKVPVGKDVTI